MKKPLIIAGVIILSVVAAYFVYIRFLGSYSTESKTFQADIKKLSKCYEQESVLREHIQILNEDGAFEIVNSDIAQLNFQSIEAYPTRKSSVFYTSVSFKVEKPDTDQLILIPGYFDFFTNSKSCLTTKREASDVPSADDFFISVFPALVLNPSIGGKI